MYYQNVLKLIQCVKFIFLWSEREAMKAAFKKRMFVKMAQQ